MFCLGEILSLLVRLALTPLGHPTTSIIKKFLVLDSVSVSLGRSRPRGQLQRIVLEINYMLFSFLEDAKKKVLWKLSRPH